MKLPTALLGLAAVLTAAAPAPAAVIVASGQNNGDPTHTSGNFFYAIDTATGRATPISPPVAGPTPAGLAGAPDGTLYGFAAGSVVRVDPYAGTFAPVAPAGPLTVTGFDITRDGAGYGVPLGADRRLHRFDLATGAAAPVGPAGAIGAALDAFFGDPPGANPPFIISLGSVGAGSAEALYGVHLAAGRNQLVAIDPGTGAAAVVGPVNSVGTGGPGPGTYSGFAALTGVDEDGDGVNDALFGAVNFFDPDGPGPLPSGRLGGVARYDLAAGTWTLVGTNPGLIFFGFGSSPAAVPAPPSAVLAAAGVAALGAYRRRRPGRPASPVPDTRRGSAADDRRG
jgi:MYXO-CTERM domain-containing protein